MKPEMMKKNLTTVGIQVTAAYIRDEDRAFDCEFLNTIKISVLTDQDKSLKPNLKNQQKKNG